MKNFNIFFIIAFLLILNGCSRSIKNNQGTISGPTVPASTSLSENSEGAVILNETPEYAFEFFNIFNAYASHNPSGFYEVIQGIGLSPIKFYDENNDLTSYNVKEVFKLNSNFTLLRFDNGGIGLLSLKNQSIFNISPYLNSSKLYGVINEGTLFVANVPKGKIYKINLENFKVSPAHNGTLFIPTIGGENATSFRGFVVYADQTIAAYWKSTGAIGECVEAIIFPDNPNPKCIHRPGNSEPNSNRLRPENIWNIFDSSGGSMLVYGNDKHLYELNTFDSFLDNSKYNETFQDFESKSRLLNDPNRGPQMFSRGRIFRIQSSRQYYTNSIVDLHFRPSIVIEYNYSSSIDMYVKKEVIRPVTFFEEFNSKSGINWTPPMNGVSCKTNYNSHSKKLYKILKMGYVKFFPADDGSIESEYTYREDFWAMTRGQNRCYIDGDYLYYDRAQAGERDARLFRINLKENSAPEFIVETDYPDRNGHPLWQVSGGLLIYYNGHQTNIIYLNENFSEEMLNYGKVEFTGMIDLNKAFIN